jgi:hypothetical protein
VIRSDGAGFPRPKTLRGTIIGNTTAAPVVAMKRRRLIPLREVSFISFGLLFGVARKHPATPDGCWSTPVSN